MNATLKAIAQQRGYDPERIEALISLFGGDQHFVEQLLLSRAKSHDDQHLVARYKAPSPPTDPLAQHTQMLAAVALYTMAIQRQQARAQQLATTTKAARSDPFALVMQGGHEVELVPR